MTGSERETRRLREAFASTSPSDAPTQACPAPSTLWEAARDELGITELREILEHVASCSTCTEAWRLAVEVSGDRLASARDSSRDDRGSAARVGWTAAAAAAGAFLFFSLGYDGSVQVASTSRAGGGSAAPLELRLISIESSSSTCRVSWTEIENATYDVSLLSQEAELLDESLYQEQASFVVGGPVLAAIGDDPLQLHVKVRRGREGVVVENLFDVRCDST